MYRERPPKKWFISYIAPFLIIIIIFVWWVFSFQKLLFKDSSFNDTFAILNTEKWNTEVMLAWKNEWRSSPVKMKLFKNDAIKTLDKWAFIEIPWDSKIIMDKESSLVIENIEADNSFRDVGLMLTDWRIWLNAQRMLNPKSKLVIKLDKIEFSTRWWVFSLEPNWIRIMEWEWLIDIVENWRIIWHLAIWIWQEILLSETDVRKIALWELPWVNAISDEFRLSEWYKSNYKDEDKSIAEMIKTEKENTWSSVISENESNNNSPSNPEAQDNTTNNETENQITWALTIDIEDKEIEIKSKTDVYSITWKVSSNTAIVHVNWWKLSKFQYWDWSYKYNASLVWENLQAWENTFKVQAYDKGYKLIDSKEKTINVILKAEASEEIIDEWTSSVTEESSTWSSMEPSTNDEVLPKIAEWTILQITSPVENEIVSWEPVEIKWIASEDTAKIIVWDYELKTFKKWDKTFMYRAASTWWNLIKWEKNTYVIKAYNDEWKEIESIKFSFFADKE